MLQILDEEIKKQAKEMADNSHKEKMARQLLIDGLVDEIQNKDSTIIFNAKMSLREKSEKLKGYSFEVGV